MNTVEVNRADLAWALRAVLPHVGQHEPKDTVGLGESFAWATDGYTLGIAQIGDGAADLLVCWLPSSEAKELERSIRCARKAEEEESVWLLVNDAELHVQVGEEPGVVYDLTDRGPTAEFVNDYIGRLNARPAEQTGLVVNPKLLSRFTKAQRFDSDRLQLDGYNVDTEHGDILVRVGDRFVGAVAGMTYHGGAVGEAA